MTPAQYDAIQKRYESNLSKRDLGFGIVSSTIANCNRNPKKRRKPFEPKDFMPVYKEQKKLKKSPDELLHYFQNFVIPRFETADKAQGA